MVIDAGRSRAAQIPESHNHPGFTGISGQDLLAALSRQARRYGVTITPGEVTALRRTDGSFIATANTAEHGAARVLLATGITDIGPDLPGLDAAVARSAIRYCPVCDGFEATDTKVAVYGSVDDALDKALFLRTYTRELTILPAGAAKDLPREAADAGIAIAPEPPERFWQTPTGLGVQLTSGKRLEFDSIYPVLGCEVHSDLARSLGADCSTTGLLQVDERQQTSVEGLYAAGDVVSDLHQLSVAEGHAAIAATAIHNSLPRNFR
jgi:thioredoxin reductase (NADPH)